MAFTAVSAALLDAMLDVVIANTDRILLCSAEPADAAEAETFKLATLTPSGGDYAKSNSGTGRKLTFNATTGNTPDFTGEANFYACINDTASRLELVGTLNAPKDLDTSEPFDTEALDLVTLPPTLV